MVSLAGYLGQPYLVPMPHLTAMIAGYGKEEDPKISMHIVVD
jgi:hypothetical protein